MDKPNSGGLTLPPELVAESRRFGIGPAYQIIRQSNVGRKSTRAHYRARIKRRGRLGDCGHLKDPKVN